MKLLLFDHFMRASYCFAVEEYILTNPKFNDEYFLLWNTKDTVMVGRFQNTVEEVNLEYTKAEGIDIIRRNLEEVIPVLKNLGYEIVGTDVNEGVDVRNISKENIAQGTLCITARS